ncbi:MAG TPA: phage terminase large subunit [Planctomycetota bacterium]|nr:phage terminase large subunit [Planctomycetota bacterium]
MSVNLIFQPHAGKQELFVRHPARTVGYGGSAGSGKSEALLYHFGYLLDFEDQRYRRGEIRKSSAWTCYFRRVYPNLKQAVAKSLRTFNQIDPRAKWNAADHVWTFECGLHFMFGAIEKTHDYLKFYSFEFQGLYWDELTEFEEEQFDQLETRLRSSDPHHKRFENIRWGSNPVGPGLIWVRRRFVDPAPPGTTVRVRTKLGDGRYIEQDQVFIQAFLKDNPSLYEDGRYEASLRKNKPHIFKALFEGNWHYTPGGLLAEFWKQDLHVVPNHQVPPNVRRFRSADFGINAYTSITWWYVDRDGCMTAYYHLYVKDLTVDKMAPRIREIEKYLGDWDEEENRSLLRMSPLDAACWARDAAGGPSIADEFRRRGIMWIPSIKDRVNGIAEVMRRLSQTVKIGEDENGQPILKPMIRWMKRCEAPTRILPVLPRDPNNPEDVPKNCEDHVLDDTMYACGSNPLKPKLAVVKDDDDLYDEEEAYARRWRSGGRFAEVG